MSWWRVSLRSFILDESQGKLKERGNSLSGGPSKANGLHRRAIAIEREVI